MIYAPIIANILCPVKKKKSRRYRPGFTTYRSIVKYAAHTGGTGGLLVDPTLQFL